MEYRPKKKRPQVKGPQKKAPQVKGLQATQQEPQKKGLDVKET